MLAATGGCRPFDEPRVVLSALAAFAPAAISDKATILTLDSQGYQTAVRGTSGFNSLVERSWMAPFGSPDCWNPKIRGPVCYNPAASGSILGYTLRRTKLALAGASRGRILDEVRAAFARNGLPSPEPGAMSFMMSKDGYLGVPERCRRPLAPTSHVPRAKIAGASKPARVSGDSRRSRGSGAPDDIHGAGVQLVGRNGGGGSLVGAPRPGNGVESGVQLVVDAPRRTAVRELRDRR